MFEANPFRPGKRLTDPDFFSGRKTQLHTATRVLAQTGDGNGRHALVTGERGIGKSSFSSQVQGIARGELAYLRLADVHPAEFSYSFLVSEHIAQAGQSVGDIVAGLLHGLEAAKGLARFAKVSLDFEVDLGPLKTAVRQKDADPQEVTSRFVDELEKISRKVAHKVDGILLVVDEVDSVAGKSGVSTFFKVVTEMLEQRQLKNITFFLVGIRGTLEMLREEHPSAGRIFRLLEVPLMNSRESHEVLTRALNTTSIGIDQDAADVIAELSGGFPNTLHLLGEQAFELASEEGLRQITAELVGEATAAVVEGAAREDFDPRYLAIKGRSRNIIRYMASKDGRDVASADICAHLRVRPTDISANFDTMLRSDVLERPRDGIYRLRDPLFREYIRHIMDKNEEPVQRRPRSRSAG